MLKRFMAGLLAAAVLTTPVYADTEYEYTAQNIQAYADTLENGSYYVPVQLWHAYADQESMGNSAFKENPNALVKVKDGAAVVQVVTNPVKVAIYYSALENLRYTDASGNIQYASPAQKEHITAYGSENGTDMAYFDMDYLRIFEINIPADKSKYIPVEIRTPYTPMQLVSEWTEARLKFDWANAVKTEDTSITPNPVSPESITSDPNKEYLFGSNKKALKAGTYDIGISMKNAGNLDKDSVAASCIKGGKLIVSDNAAEIEMDLQAVSVGTISDWAEQWKIYKSGLDSETFNADETLNSDGKVEKIRFSLPDTAADGVYINMFVPVMNSAPNAYLLFDYDSLGTEKTPEIYKGTAHVERFGGYDINVEVTVVDGKITEVGIEGDNFAGTYADFNKMKLQAAADGMKESLSGRSSTDAEDINSVDAVTSATVSSDTIKEAVLNALSLKIEEEKINIPKEKLQQGRYTVDIAYCSELENHSLVENEKAKGILSADENGNITLTVNIISGTEKEPLYVLDFNGYYTDNDKTKPLKTDAKTVKSDIDYSDDIFTAGTKVVTSVSFPLEGDYAKAYNTNTKIYVPAMKNLNGTIKDTVFVNGVFDADCFVTIYWDSLEKKFDYGDVDCDGNITAGDAAYILQKALKSTFALPIQAETDDYMKYADVDPDDDITASDAAYVLQKALTSTFSLPCENPNR